MASPFTRRSFTLGGSALLLSAGTACARMAKRDWQAELAAIEHKAGGRLGVFVLNTRTGQGIGWRQHERFTQCSTFKLSLAALILRESDAKRLSLDEVLPFTRADLLAASPVTTANLDRGGMTIAQLAEAAQRTSDNAAANLLLRRLGGPQRLTEFWRELGDPVARLDNYEPALNRVAPGEVRDTASPEGIARSAAKFVVGDVLAPPSRALLQDWMVATQTGLRRIRAALPSGWRGGDKTGTAGSAGLPDRVNDIAVLFPPGNLATLVVVGFYEAPGHFDSIRPEDEAVLQQVGEVAIRWAT